MCNNVGPIHILAKPNGSSLIKDTERGHSLKKRK